MFSYTSENFVPSLARKFAVNLDHETTFLSLHVACGLYIHNAAKLRYRLVSLPP